MIDQAKTLRAMVQASVPPRTGHARVIAITSGKGGVGKTNIAANMATVLAKMGCRTAILDGDLGLANVGIVLGISAQYDIGHVIAGQKRILDIAVSGPGGLQVFTGGTGLYDVANLSASRLTHFLNSLVELDQVCDLLLIDTGAGLGEATIRLVLSAAEVVLVTTPEPTALTDAYGMVKVIARRSPGTHVSVVVNMVHREGEGQAVFHHLQAAVQQFLGYGLSYLGEVPFDALVGRAVHEQTPFVNAYPNAHISRAVESLARTLMGMDVPTAGGLRGLIQRMIRSRN